MPEAAIELAARYWRGQGVPLDASKASLWLRTAAKAPLPQVPLAICLSLFAHPGHHATRVRLHVTFAVACMAAAHAYTDTSIPRYTDVSIRRCVRLVYLCACMCVCACMCACMSLLVSGRKHSSGAGKWRQRHRGGRAVSSSNHPARQPRRQPRPPPSTLGTRNRNAITARPRAPARNGRQRQVRRSTLLCLLVPFHGPLSSC